MKKYLIITESKNKQYILSKINALDTFYNVKISSIDEVNENLTFSYDKKLEIYLHQTLGYHLDIIPYVIKAFRYLDINKKYDSFKLSSIQENYRKIIDNSLITPHLKYLDYYNSFDEIILYNLDENKEEIRLLKKHISTKISLYNQSKTYDSFNIYEYESKDKEVNAIFYKIATLINEGVSINKIHIVNCNDEEEKLIDKYAKFYNIPIQNIFENRLIDFPITNELLAYLENNPKEEALKKLDANHLADDNYPKFRNAFVNILNNYYFAPDLKPYLNVLIKDFKSTKIKGEIYTEAISLIDIEDIHDDDHYYFIMSFNYGRAPRIYKDDTYLSNKELEAINMNTSNELNAFNENMWKKKITSAKNIYIFYSLKTDFELCYPSDLLLDLNKTIIKNEIPSNISFSNIVDNLLFKEYEEKGEIPPSYLLDRHFDSKNIKEEKYDNNFNGLDNESIQDIRNNLKLSYSSLDTYYHCAFRYYVEKVLKVNKFEDTFAARIGTIFHDILRHCFEEDFDIEEAYKNHIEHYSTSAKERFYLEKLKDILYLDIEFVKEQRNQSAFKDHKFEKEFVVNNTVDGLPYIFKGYIDKVMYTTKDEQIYASVIDYKTGDPKLIPELNKFGLKLQLPCYLYLLRNNEQFKNARFAGYYLHTIFPKLPTEANKDQKSQIKLKGFSNKDIEVIKMFDPTFMNSMFIQSLSYGNNKFGYYSKTISDNEIEELINLTKLKIEEAAREILNGRFPINPKFYKKDNIGCEYCQYKDLCYKNESNLVFLKPKSND